MHIIASNQMGGTERMLCYLVPNYDKQKFTTCLVTYAAPSKYTNEWKRAGIEQIFFLNTSTPLTPIAFVRIFKIINQWKPHVIIAFGLRANIPARLAAWLCRVPLFITGQRGIEDWKGMVAVLLEKWTSVFVDLYIGNSKACCNMLAHREKIPPHKLHVIYNGIQLDIPNDCTERANNMRAKYYPPNAVVIGSIGRINPVKGYEYLIRAIPKILEYCPNAFFVIVGHDQYNRYIHTLVNDMGLGNKVLLPGYSSDVAVWLKSFDIFTLPSISEGMPVSILEAFLMKCPVVATNVGGTSELVQHNHTGLLVPPRDPNALAETIIKLIKTPFLRNKLKEKAYVVARSKYSLENMTSQYCSLIEDFYKKYLLHHTIS